MKGKLPGVIAFFLALLGILLSSSTPTDAATLRPIIFVHGGAGSGAQFESQAMRFASNGYPHEYIYVLEYDSSFTLNTYLDVYANLDALIARVQDETGAEQVDILGHSLGTTMMIGGTISDTVTPGYLNSSAERAAKVAHYVNIDGRTATALPGTVVGVPVPTLALWAGRGVPDRAIVGATNVVVPNQTHVQSASSAESFVEMYKFFTGRPPRTKEIEPGPHDQVSLAGRAVRFPQNQGVPNASVEIWQVNGYTGARIGNRPEAVYTLGSDGSWGPFNARAGAYYEMVVRHASGLNHHFYFERFIRSDYLIRLNTEVPGQDPLGGHQDTAANQSDLIITRYKEFWGDQGAENDILQINGVNVINAATCPITKRAIGIFVYDAGADGLSDVSAPIPFYFGLSFLTAVDLHVPGAYPPNGTIPIVLTTRGGGGRTQVINVPNWSSTNDRISATFNDYLVARPTR